MGALFIMVQDIIPNTEQTKRGTYPSETIDLKRLWV